MWYKPRQFHLTYLLRGPMRIRVGFLAVLLLVVVPRCPAAEIDWTKVRNEAVQLLQELIRIDTTNPPGNERVAALHLQKLLASDGIETRVLDVAPGRANLYARIKGEIGRASCRERV